MKELDEKLDKSKVQSNLLYILNNFDIPVLNLASKYGEKEFIKIISWIKLAFDNIKSVDEQYYNMFAQFNLEMEYSIQA